MSNNHELKNPDLRPTTMRDDSDSANLPGFQLSEQDLEAVGGGAIATIPMAIDAAIENPNPHLEKINDPITGGLVDTPEAIGNAVDNIFG